MKELWERIARAPMGLGFGFGVGLSRGRAKKAAALPVETGLLDMAGDPILDMADDPISDMRAA